MNMKLAIAGLLAAASFGASAADQSVAITTTPVLDTDNHFIGVTVGSDGLLSGGMDKISFTGLDAGVYDFVLTLSGQNISIDGAMTNLNGVMGTAYSFGKYRFLGVEYTGNSPFTLELFGTAMAGATYSGEVTVSAVPEPATYGMLLAGLGMVGAIARRRKTTSRGA
jgi:opacity protein-like surface antigen